MHDISYRRHRFPGEIISHAVWFDYRFKLSYRDIEELLAERGIDVSCETVHRWCAKFGAAYAKRLPVVLDKPSTTWHIDEVLVRIAGKQMYLWRLVDDEGEVLDVLLQTRRNKRAATRFLRRTLKTRGCAPAEIVNDKWRPTAASIQETIPSVDHVTGKRLKNRAENSHQPTRRRERKLQRFKTAKSAQRLLSTFTAFYNRFNVQRHLLSRKIMREYREQAMVAWMGVVAARASCALNESKRGSVFD